MSTQLEGFEPTPSDKNFFFMLKILYSSGPGSF